MKKLIILLSLFGVTLYGAVGIVVDKDDGIVSVPNVASTADLATKLGTSAVVQTTGTNTTQVMSQNSVTTNLTALDARLTEASSFGNLYIHDGTNELTVTSTNYTQITGWTTNGSSYTTLTTSNITVLADGDYAIGNFVSFDGQNNGVYEGAVFVNGVHQNNGEWSRTMGAAAAVGSAGSRAIYTLSSNAVVDLRISCSVFTTDPTIRQASFTVEKITGLKGDTGDPLDVIVQTLTGDETNKVPSVAAVNDALLDKANVGGYRLDKPDGSWTNYTAFSTVNAAAEYGDTIRLPHGYIEADWTVVSGVRYVGMGDGRYQNDQIDIAGGTIFVGLVQAGVQTNFTIQNIGFYCGDDAQNTNDTALIGGVYGGVVNALIEDCTFYGNYTNSHNVQFEGGNFTVRRCKSYAAGTHTFPVKTFNSLFEDCYIDCGTANSGLYIKSDAAGVDLYNNVFRNMTVKSGTAGIGVLVNAYAGRSIYDQYFDNLIVEMGDGAVAFRTAVSLSPVSTGTISNFTFSAGLIDDSVYGIVTTGATSPTQTHDIKINGVTFRKCTNGIFNSSGVGGTNIYVNASAFIDTANPVAGETGSGYMTVYGEGAP